MTVIQIDDEIHSAGRHELLQREWHRSTFIVPDHLHPLAEGWARCVAEEFHDAAVVIPLRTVATERLQGQVWEMGGATTHGVRRVLSV